MPITDFRGRTAVVTGAASGIGLALAERLAREGMNIVMADVEAEALATAVAQVTALGARAIGVPVDVRDPAQIDALAERTIAEFGEVSLLCNNAGVGAGAPFAEVPEQTWRWVMDVNFFGVVNGCRAFLPLLERSPEAHIVNTGSVASFYTGTPTFGPYIASKFAVLGVSESLAMELASADSSVGVSIAAPGVVRTRINDAERNLPADVPRTSDNPVSRATLEGFQSEMDVEAMSPKTVADLVVDAVRNDRFYVLTHPEWALGAVADRLSWMTDGTNPTRG